MSERRSLSSILVFAAVPLVLLTACSASSDPRSTSQTQVASNEAEDVSGTVEASESCVDVGKPNPTAEDVAEAFTTRFNVELGLPAGSARPDTIIVDFDEFMSSVPEGGFSKFASAVCNRPLNPFEKPPGPPEQSSRGGLVLRTAVEGICSAPTYKVWDSVDELKESRQSMFAGNDPEAVPEGDLTGTTYGQYIENNSSFLQAALDYVCPQNK